jgi:hypothetical protein
MHEDTAAKMHTKNSDLKVPHWRLRCFVESINDNLVRPVLAYAHERYQED